VSGQDTLRREAFLLAYHLHWPLESILALPVGDRRLYLELLTAQLEREADAMKGRVGA
jgi:hypothetical protein